MFRRALNDDAPPITKASLQKFIVTMRQRNVKPVSVNAYIKAMNASVAGCTKKGTTPTGWELPLLKLEKRVLQTLTDEQMTALLSRKPKGFVGNRLHALIAFVLDTGVRIDEALTVRASAVGYDNLLPSTFR